MSVSWPRLLDDARAYLGLDDDEPVPIDQLIAQATANGYTEREARHDLRDTDDLVLAGDDFDSGVVHTPDDYSPQPHSRDETLTPAMPQTPNHDDVRAALAES